MQSKMSDVMVEGSNVFVVGPTQTQITVSTSDQNQFSITPSQQSRYE